MGKRMRMKTWFIFPLNLNLWLRKISDYNHIVTQISVIFLTSLDYIAQMQVPKKTKYNNPALRALRFNTIGIMNCCLLVGKGGCEESSIWIWSTRTLFLVENITRKCFFFIRFKPSSNLPTSFCRYVCQYWANDLKDYFFLASGSCYLLTWL